MAKNKSNTTAKIAKATGKIGAAIIPAVANFRASASKIWRGLPGGVRTGLIVYLAVVLLLIVVAGARRWSRVEEKIQTSVVTSVDNLPIPVTVSPTKIVIDSPEQATLAEALDDNDTSVEIKSQVSEQEMVRIANDWLLPQLMQLDGRAVQLRRSLEKDKRYLAQQEPLVEPTRAEVAKLEEDYRRASAALDLPALPNSNFYEQMQSRFDNVRAQLDKARKRLRTLEEGVGAAQRRLNTDEPILAQLEVEVINTRERLEKVRARDAKVLAITYQYAISGFTTLPLLRFLGKGSWDIRLINDISVAFERRFHRSLPISAYGQSKTHDRMGWDHSNAVDVALHPASDEGLWLTTYLREREMPFLAFRTSVPGMSSGPHVHIGTPSHRLPR
ncbi:MAG: hypothetical protein AB1489_17145 [Acidobacteriota bacterium]